jgi:UDP-glucose 4-epimerase
VTTWLLTGGAGYIGPHIARSFLASGRDIVIIDDLANGFEESVPDGVAFIRANLREGDVVEQVLRDHSVTGVVHLAALKAVGESVEQPLRYYRENLDGMLTLLERMQKVAVKKMVFSSSAAVYGEVAVETITEETRQQPTSPYGETKLIGEWMMKALHVAGHLDAIALRYFNVAGSGAPELGDRGVNNLIPMVFRALEQGDVPQVFGGDWPTRDGSAIRDYIHVVDLAEAHLAAAAKLESVTGADSILRSYNIGTGNGTTVLEVIEAVRAATSLSFEPEMAQRRPGDPARVVADSSAARRELGWEARFTINDMVSSAWDSWRHQHGPSDS